MLRNNLLILMYNDDGDFDAVRWSNFSPNLQQLLRRRRKRRRQVISKRKNEAITSSHSLKLNLNYATSEIQ